MMAQIGNDGINTAKVLANINIHVTLVNKVFWLCQGVCNLIIMKIQYTFTQEK